MILASNPSFVVMGWEIDAGPLHFSRNGVAVKPQLKVGYADDNVNVRAGVEDVRNGLSAALAGQVHRTYESEGNGMNQVCAVLCRGQVPHESQRLCAAALLRTSEQALVYTETPMWTNVARRAAIFACVMPDQRARACRCTMHARAMQNQQGLAW